jgi:chromosome partitioning protein
VNALTASDSVLIPTQCEYYALEGLSQLIATLNLVRDHLNPPLAIKGVVLTMYDARTNLSADVATEVRSHLGDAVFDTIIPRSVRLSEAPSFGVPIAMYRADSRGALAYAALARELRQRDGRPISADPDNEPSVTSSDENQLDHRLQAVSAGARS